MYINDIKTTIEFTLTDYELEMVETYAKEQGWTIEECMDNMIRDYMNRIIETQIDTWEGFDESKVEDRCYCLTSNDCICNAMHWELDNNYNDCEPVQLSLDLKGEHDGK